MVDPRAGTPAEPQDLVDLDALAAAYYDRVPDPEDPAQQVSFGTSGHRGSSLDTAFNEAHILATTQAIVEYRAQAGIDGPLLLARDTHALSLPAWQSALEVLIGNDVVTLVDTEDGFTPTPAVSHAILRLNGLGAHGQVDGIVVTPSHNPPRDGGFKYNPPNGGPAGSDVTGWVQDRANTLLRDGLRGVRRATTGEARGRAQTYDFLTHYVNDLGSVLDMEAIARAGVRIGADPLGGASVAYWGRIGEQYGLDLTVVNPAVDPQWGFMTLDHDAKIRMDCSSPYAMASLVSQRDHFDIATGNDADADRHGIVTPDAGLMNPNHFLAVAIAYLTEHRGWDAAAGVGKTVVSSSMIDRVVADAGRALYEVPVGFKWFVDPLISGSVVFGGEESAGASFLRRDGSVWTTDKDGIILALLASEIQAVTGRSPSQHYVGLTARHGDPAYARVDSPATRDQKARLGALDPSAITATELAGDPITRILSHAPGNDAPLGGIKVETADAWFAARPSGTEDVYKIYAESFRGADHLAEVQEAARATVDAALT
ncbi:phosphoglucomutase (alpha-D-glucose-1,6-bisphosphate-dependent) [Mumia quercus]|uniref:phosphoglucomutase (alpha-D-glucose-1,6-bisphosphate-dependent) n=1 Tax=Mumia quercus TaxID=2976125 RepID=UPI0021CE2679|nr:phosphoglucomutase (alpha-D-glucose-1,6-bisphosphate-dependent) [Mumia quercus]